MRITDNEGNDLANPDLASGELVMGKVIRPDATPIDNETKFAWSDDDYEDVLIYTPIDEQRRLMTRIADLKRNLDSTDYIACKTVDAIIACGSADEISAVISAAMVEYGDIIKERSEWRREVNSSEARLMEIRGQK